MSKIPRGIRNNNPGNIERGANWLGLDTFADMSPEQREETRFCVFRAPEYGIRAICKILMTYQRTHRLRTIRQMINRWAPPVENDTGAYVQSVAKRASVGPDDPVDVTSPVIMRALVEAIITHENGQQPYPPAVIDAGLRLAGVLPRPVPKESDRGPVTETPVVEVPPSRGVWLAAVLRWVAGLLARLGRRHPAE